MIFTSTSLFNVIVYNSITNTLDDVKFDNVKPFSFIEFLNYAKSLNSGMLEFREYQVYIKKWNEVSVTKATDINEVIRNEFINFLKAITVNYTTVEEKRYLSNIDFNSNEDLEVAVPFFSQKIKEVLLYFANKRDTYQLDIELVKNKGSIEGVETYLRTAVIETMFGNDLLPDISTTSTLSAVTSQLKIEVEQGYDVFNDYFDLDPFQPAEFYTATGDRAKYFTANTNIADKNLFLDYDQAIIDLINSERVVLEQLQSLVVTINEPNLDLLQDYDFINYNTGDRTRDNLKLVLNAELIKKFTGTDFYYLSATSNGPVSGLLFAATSPFANLLNIYNPTTLTVPQSSNKFERDVGLFFKPTNQSILKLQTPFTYTSKDVIDNDFVYIFPDPNSYGNVVGLTKTDHTSPFDYVQDGNKIQRNVSSNLAIGNSFVTSKDFTFESYHSREQINPDNSLADLYNNGVITTLTSDIYGNVFFGLKQNPFN